MLNSSFHYSFVVVELEGCNINMRDKTYRKDRDPEELRLFKDAQACICDISGDGLEEIACM